MSKNKILSLYFTKGFTLIELLVVIAIIGILASVVLASLNSARNKGSNAAVKSSISQIRLQSEIWYSNNNSKYNISGIATGSCSSANTIFIDPVISQSITNITNNSDQANPPACFTDAAGQKWAVSATLKDGISWCVDNSGWVNEGTAFNGGFCTV